MWKQIIDFSSVWLPKTGINISCLWAGQNDCNGEMFQQICTEQWHSVVGAGWLKEHESPSPPGVYCLVSGTESRGYPFKTWVCTNYMGVRGRGQWKELTWRYSGDDTQAEYWRMRKFSLIKKGQKGFPGDRKMVQGNAWKACLYVNS